MNESLKATVVIPTYNGAHKLPVTLDALCKQTFNDFEVVIVVDGSNDNTIDTLHLYKNKFKGFHVVVQQNGGRAKARNCGVNNAKGKIIIFLDDDIEVGPDNIESHIVFIDKNPGSMLIGFPQLNKQKIGKDSFLKYRYRNEEEARKRLPQNIFQVNFNNYLFSTQNLSIQKDVFLAIGKFDERLTDSEDFDFSVRALTLKYTIYCNARLLVFHNDFADLMKTITRQQQYYKSKKQVMDMHPQYVTLMPDQYEWSKPLPGDGVKRSIFKRKKFWFSFFSRPLFTVWPDKIKDALYSSFIYSQSVLPLKSKLHT